MSVSSAATTGRHLGWRVVLGSEGRSYTGGYHPPDNTAATHGDCTVLYCTVLYCDQVALQPGPPAGAGAGLAPPHRPHRQPVPPQGPPAHGLPGECRPVRTQVWGIHNTNNNITYHIIILQTTLRQDAPAAAPAAEAAEG